jgi:hypothetical protein
MGRLNQSSTHGNDHGRRLSACQVTQSEEYQLLKYTRIERSPLVQTSAGQLPPVTL